MSKKALVSVEVESIGRKDHEVVEEEGGARKIKWHLYNFLSGVLFVETVCKVITLDLLDYFAMRLKGKFSNMSLADPSI
jgi:hypothetical protein